MSLAPGSRLGAYEIVQLIDSGGMGDVYLAHDPRLRRQVAVKVLPPEFAADPGRVQRFEREARAVAALNHPNIAAIYDVGRDADVHYLVMEYVRGETLAAFMLRERAPCGRGLEIGAEIAAALAAAHESQIAHRDLKPRNVMVTADGHAKVLDFGLAKTVPAGSHAAISTADLHSTIPGEVLGTPGYMSPEQLLGTPVDHRTDIYSLGVILFELVTGRRLFPDMGWDAISYATLKEPTRRAADVDPSVPAAVSDLIARAMDRDPVMRPQSAREFKNELETTRSRIASRTTSSGWTNEVRWRWGRTSRRARVATMTLAAAVAIAVMALLAWRADSPAPESPSERAVIAVLPFTNLTGDESKAYIGVGIADMLTTSLGRLSSVSVVSRAALRESPERRTTNLARITQDLGATMLVLGSYQQAGDRLRVHATLVLPDGTIQWSGDSEANLEDLFLLESRLAGTLIDGLRVTVTDSERQQLARPPTQDRAALEAYWQGMTFLDRTDNTDIDRAILAFQRAISIDQAFSLARAGLGEAYRRKSLADNDALLMRSAVDEVTEALRLDPEQAEVRLSLARVYRSTGRNGAAVEELRRALEDQPANDDALRQLGDVLANDGRPDEALDALQRAVAVRPQYWRNLQSLGLFYLRTGKAAEAVTTLTRLTQVKPDDATPWQQLGAAYQTLGDVAHARQSYEKSISVGPSAGSYANLGMIEYSEGRYAQAAIAYEEAIKLAPGGGPYHRNLGDTYLKLGRQADARTAYERAVRLAEEALAVNPSDAMLMSQLAVYEAKVGRGRDAERHADGAAAINPSSPEVLYRRAVVLALNGNAKAAVTRLSEAIARGYPKRLAAEDDDLAPVRSLPAFESLTSGAQ